MSKLPDSLLSPVSPSFCAAMLTSCDSAWVSVVRNLFVEVSPVNSED